MTMMMPGSTSFMPRSSSGVLPKLVQPAQIGDYLTCDVILGRTTEFDAEVTEYPVEDGFSISDHCVRKPLKLTLDVLFTPTPVTWWNEFLGGSRHSLNVVINEIMQIWQQGEPVTITLVDAIYTDMVMTSAPMPRRSEDGYCYKATLQFQHVRRVTQRAEEIPEDGMNEEESGKGGETNKDGGDAPTEEIGTGLRTVEPGENTGSDILGVNTDNIDLSQFGSIGIGLEATAYMAAVSIANSIGSESLTLGSGSGRNTGIYATSGGGFI